MVNKGRNRDTAWFALIDSDWPAVKAGFEAWLAADNFDGAGQQRARLETGGRRAEVAFKSVVPQSPPPL